MAPNWEISPEGIAATTLSLMSIMRRNIRKTRKDLNIPLHSENREVMPWEYQDTANNEQFLICDSGAGDQERIFVFASENRLQFLAQSEHWYADGKSRASSEIFFQLYSVHGQKWGSIFPRFRNVELRNWVTKPSYAKWRHNSSY